jgi:ring-1,2-phenylacetyl-CoA epoxidase subunit PaaD
VSEAAWSALAGVSDPELPFLDVVDLGVVRDVRCEAEGTTVVITPTYSGCPALEIIEEEVAKALEGAGFGPVAVERQLAPAWTTDWITERGKALLSEHGIAPPGPVPEEGALVTLRVPVPCPRCGSKRTEELSRFGSTACKALHRCLACEEPFDAVKPL